MKNRKIDGHSTKRKMAVTLVAAICLILLYVVTWSFSAQDVEESGSFSKRFTEAVVEIVNSLTFRDWSDMAKKEIVAYFEHPMRKLAHFSEYACMGGLVYILWRQWMDKGKRLYALCVIWVFVSAGADEFHQTFVQGRYGSFADVCLDTLGAVCAVFICTRIDRAITRRYEHKNS